MKKTLLLTVGGLILVTFSVQFLSSSHKHKPYLLKIEKGPDPILEEGGEEESDQMDKAMLQEYYMTRDLALNVVPRERLLVADSKRASMLVSPSSPTAITWSERGPTNIAGRVRAILYDMNDATNNTVIVAGVAGGLWRTTNFKTASTWTPVNDLLGNLAFCSIAQDPRIPNRNIMYAGTGEGYFNIDQIRGVGIYKSTDFGLTWTLLPFTTPPAANAPNFEYIQRLLVDASGNVYAATRSHFCNAGGLWKSTNGGTNWTFVLGTSGVDCPSSFNMRVNDIELANNGDLYVTTGLFTTGRVFRSLFALHGGATGNAGTWQDVTPAGGSYWRIELAVAPSNNQRVYALFQGNGSNNVIEIRRSDDAGATWTAAGVLPVPTIFDQGANSVFTRNQAFYDLTVAVDPNNADVVLIGGIDLLRSTDAGLNWTQISNWTGAGGGFTANQFVHADQHIALYEGTSSSNAVFGCDGGIFYTTNVNTGGLPTFVSKNAGLRITQYYAADLHPSTTNYIIGGAQDNGSLRLNAAGLTTAATFISGDGAFTHIDQTDGMLQTGAYVFSQYAFSENGGRNWFGLYNFDADNDARFINPSDYGDVSNVLYVCDSVGRYGIITNLNNIPAAPSYFRVDMFSLVGSRQVSAVKEDPNTPNRIWFGMSDDDNGVLAPTVVVVDSANTAPSANQFALPVSASAGQYISSIDVEQGNLNHILVTISNFGATSVYESTNGGTNWTAVEGNLPDMPIRWGKFLPTGVSLSPNAVSGVVLATELGIFSTTTLSAGTTVWAANNGGLANVRIDMLQYRASDRTLLAATHGRGIFTAVLNVATPVNFLTFKGKAEQNYNNLTWTTAEEQNNQGFEVQRKQSGENEFKKIGFIPAKERAQSVNGYSFNDSWFDLSKENVSYRLRQVDLDGNFKFSTIINLNRKPSTKFVEYITMNGNDLFLRINTLPNSPSLDLIVYDASGKLIVRRKIAPQTQQVNLGSAGAGIYTVKLSGGTQTFTGRVVKPK